MKHSDEYDAEIQQSINYVVLQELLELSVNTKVTFQVKAIALANVKELRKWLQTSGSKKIKYSYVQGYIYLIDTYLKQPFQFKKEKPLKIPDGSPIGTISCEL